MKKFPRILTVLALAGLAFGGLAFAKGQPKASQNNAAQMMQSYRQKTQQLHQIQQKTIKNNPKLAAEIKHFQGEMQASMRAHGYDVDKGRKRVEAMVKEFKSKKMTKAERASAMKSFQAERQKMMKARAAAMHDPKIQKDDKALQMHMIAAMKKQDSHTGPLLEQVKSLRMKILSAMAAKNAASKKKG